MTLIAFINDTKNKKIYGLADNAANYSCGLKVQGYYPKIRKLADNCLISFTGHDMYWPNFQTFELPEREEGFTDKRYIYETVFEELINVFPNDFLEDKKEDISNYICLVYNGILYGFSPAIKTFSEVAFKYYVDGIAYQYGIGYLTGVLENKDISKLSEAKIKKILVNLYENVKENYDSVGKGYIIEECNY